MNDFMNPVGLALAALFLVCVVWLGVLAGNYGTWRAMLDHGCIHCDRDAHPWNWRVLYSGLVAYHEWLRDPRTTKYRKGYE